MQSELSVNIPTQALIVDSEQKQSITVVGVVTEEAMVAPEVD